MKKKMSPAQYPGAFVQPSQTDSIKKWYIDNDRIYFANEKHKCTSTVWCKSDPKLEQFCTLLEILTTNRVKDTIDTLLLDATGESLSSTSAGAYQARTPAASAGN